MGNIMMKSMKKPLAIAILAALAACTGGPSATNLPAAPSQVTPAPGSGQILVGVGDSLTAGYQSSGFLGDINPVTAPGISAYPGAAVPPGQESGFWSVMYQQMVSPLAGPFPNNAEVPVMPLIKGPGLANQIVLNATTLIASTHSGCDAFNQAAFGSSTWQSTRLNPSGTTLDLGVPGITMHEAIAMTHPITGAPNAPGCGYTAIAGDPTSGGLQSLVEGESLTFYPVLGGFQTQLGAQNLTELNAAISLKPQLATVWLGANDLLKYIFSGGLSPVSDTPAQMATDLTQIVTQLRATGAKVLVADLPNVLTTAQFFPKAKFVGDCTTMLVVSGVPLAVAPTYCSGINAALAANTSIQYGTGAYLTETGFFAVIQQAGALIKANPAAPNFAAITLDPSGAGSGLGGAYLTPAFATQVQTLNTAYNTAIDGVANGGGSGVALVPITASFNTVATSGYAVAPGETMTLQFGGGLLSWDGLHPSWTGYAVIANIFIGTADTAFGLTIPQLTAAQIAGVANGNGGSIPPDPYNPYALKVANPLSPFPFP
jgi:lysophospholipase L1-like esterase